MLEFRVYPTSDGHTVISDANGNTETVPSRDKNGQKDDARNLNAVLAVRHLAELPSRKHAAFAL